MSLKNCFKADLEGKCYILLTKYTCQHQKWYLMSFICLLKCTLWGKFGVISGRYIGQAEKKSCRKNACLTKTLSHILGFTFIEHLPNLIKSLIHFFLVLQCKGANNSRVDNLRAVGSNRGHAPDQEDALKQTKSNWVISTEHTDFQISSEMLEEPARVEFKSTFLFISWTVVTRHYTE